MSAPSGISVSDDLAQAFNKVIQDEHSARFIVASIHNESIVLDQTIGSRSSLEEDLSLLPEILKADAPAYILAKLDSTSSNSWLAISYVPDIANIRAKMLYASSRAALAKELGSGYFVDTLYANSLADLTADAYRAHLAHNAAPKPLSAKERELEEARAIERSTDPVYEGSRARKNHVGNPIGLQWAPEAEEAIQSFIDNQLAELVILSIDVATETLTLLSQLETDVDQIGSKLPESEAAYALYRWVHSEDGQVKADIVFIYSCPTSSPVKLRMLYSSGIGALVQAIKARLGPSQTITKRIELSEPKDFNDEFIRNELGYKKASIYDAQAANKPFARPRGPAKKR